MPPSPDAADDRDRQEMTLRAAAARLHARDCIQHAAHKVVRWCVLLSIHRELLEGDPELRLALLYRRGAPVGHYVQAVLPQGSLLNEIRDKAIRLVDDMLNPNAMTRTSSSHPHGTGPCTPDTASLDISPALGSGRSLRITLPGWCPCEDAKLGVLVFTARELDVPEVCIALTWYSAVAATYGIGVHDAGVDWLEAHFDDALSCVACGDPCEDADLGPEQGPAGPARDRGCVRCQPSSLCGRCSVRVGFDQVCLECITDEEAVGLTSSKLRRRKLLGDLTNERLARAPR